MKQIYVVMSIGEDRKHWAIDFIDNYRQWAGWKRQGMCIHQIVGKLCTYNISYQGCMVTYAQAVAHAIMLHGGNYTTHSLKD